MGFLEDISAYIRSGEALDQNLGLEIEHFIINDEGKQMEFSEISSLINLVGKRLGAEIIHIDSYPVGYYTGEYSTSLEPSCQFEISINPYNDLETIESIYEEFRALWEPIFRERGYHFETKGNLPLVETQAITPDDIPLSPKKRYKYMDAYFKRSGKYGKYMMRASASTQVSIDYKSEEDMVRKLTVLQKISPILMIMMENKTDEYSTLPGVEDKTHLLRIQEWDDLDPDRTGFVPFSLDDDFGYDKMAEVIYHTPLILLTDNGETVNVGHQSAEELVANSIIYTDDLEEDRKKKLIEHFMSMGFFHFRVKKYIEVRVADSVPIEKALGYVALLKGLIYSEETLEKLENELASVTSIDELQDAVEEIERYGYDAVIYDGRTASDWANKLLNLAAASLSKNDREYLKNVRTIWDNCQQAC
ncbi:glutamate--cysteine ligase [Lachnospiraceae bacterium NE2001]|nr:glutamate--cysteine ligase [Lachnospiraceae bacterium NE2001]